MSATFADDSVLVTHFDARPNDIMSAISPGSANDIGDRMILVPQELDPSVSDEQLRDLLTEKAKRCNVVVIVPSHYRATFWSNWAVLTMTADTLEEGVTRLNTGHVGLVVLVNKYDGIDLPHDACRVLVLDGLPDARRAIDRIEQGTLPHRREGSGDTLQGPECP